MKYFFLIIFISFVKLNALEYSLHQNNSKTLNAILASGNVAYGDTKRLKAFIGKLPKKKHIAIYFNSPGGNLYEGINLGLFFRDYKIKTVVDGNSMCASACAIAFLGGTDYKGEKWMSSTTKSRLGFHAFRNGDDSKLSDTNKTQKVVSDILKYGNHLDAPMEIFIHNFATPSDDMYWFSTNELLSLSIKVWDIDKECFLINEQSCEDNDTFVKKIQTNTNSEDFIVDYFTKLKNVPYQDTWDMLSNDMKRNISLNDYINWWENKVSKIKNIYTKKINKNTISAKLIYTMKNGKEICSLDTFSLIELNNKFFIDKQKYKSCKN